MKKIYALLSGAFCASTLFAQSVLYTNSFDSPGSFTLDEPSSFNNWVVNNVYQGGLNFLSSTMIPNVPAQPASFTNPNQNYLHPVSPLALNISFQPILNSNYMAGGGFSNMKAVMNTSVDATNFTNITFSFWRVGGLNGMKVIYSINGGQTWQDAGLNFQGSPAEWTEETIVISALDGQSNVRIGFEMMEAELADPAPNPYHSIDELKITGTPLPSGEISTSVSIPGAAVCTGESVSAGFAVSNGTINAGNQFTLELSDASGSFTSPTIIGTLSSTATSGNITGVIPAGLSGTGFRLRVSSSNSLIIGSDNGTNFAVVESPALPVITFNSTSGQLEVTTSATSYSWFFFGTEIPNSQNQPSISPTSNGGYTVVAINGNCETTSTIFVVNFVGLETEVLSEIQIFPNPFEGRLSISDPSRFSEVYVTDLSGKIVFQQNDVPVELNLESLSSGTYFLHLNGDAMKVYKVLKR